MDRKEIFTSLQDLLDDNYIYEKAVELQAINPAAFGQLIATLIEERNFTEERFEELYEELYEDKLDVITQYQYFASRTLISNNDMDGCVFDGTKYEEEIFGEELDDEYGRSLELHQPDFEVDVEDIDEELNERNETPEEKRKLDLLNAYQSNIDTTCLFAVLEAIMEDPELINYIPRSHAKILGIADLMDSISFNRANNNEMIELLQSIPTSYLTFASYYDIYDSKMKTLVDNVKVNIEKFKVEEIYYLPTRK